ncbi:MICOS complex subunit MIC26 isoform X2 [Ischnura elegans]|uniref:MICOS complex subunit MIC26 isoform X2 n=1 Tax=Ischnura elegans TaxID=197161 RepID=UPI001ED8B8BF|nr:MICOS complex subunit MIC26 isoform X2 [Ischnura elegans]
MAVRNLSKIMKKFLLPSSVCTASAAAVVHAAEKPKECPPPVKVVKEAKPAEGICHTGPLKIKPSELPIYDHADPPCVVEEEKKPISDLEEAVSVVRKELWVYVDDFDKKKEKMVEYVETGKAHSEFIISYLKEENNYLPRAGAIGLGGLAGLVLGLRGGFIRRILYGSAGAAAMASICYPNEAAVYSKEAVQNVKKYALIGYNFVNGVKPESKPVVSENRAEKKETSQSQSQAPKDAPKAMNKTLAKNDQSNPADKDMYTTRS